MLQVPSSTATITAEWLTEALQSRGRLKSRVANVELQPIGAGVGLMAELGRLAITYEGDEELPTSMIVKCAAQNENINVARILDFYNREVDFYNRIGRESTLNVPDSYYGDVNQETYDCVLLLEDLGDVSPRDQITGASEEDARAAIANIAVMHAKYWGAVDETDWMYDFMSVEESHKLRDMVYQPAVESCISNFSEFFDDEMRALVRTVGEQYQRVWVDQLSPVSTFIHGDYRQDNLIYGEGDAKVMDWQISGRGRGIFDVTYFMCQSLPSDVRARIERDVLEKYVADLAANGVSDYDFDTCWRDYRTLLLGCLVYPVTVCGTLDLANERGRALGECMLERNLAAIKDLNCAELLA